MITELVEKIRGVLKPISITVQLAESAKGMWASLNSALNTLLADFDLKGADFDIVIPITWQKDSDDEIIFKSSLHISEGSIKLKLDYHSWRWRPPDPLDESGLDEDHAAYIYALQKFVEKLPMICRELEQYERHYKERSEKIAELVRKIRETLAPLIIAHEIHE